jgi:hypothetical protein
VNVAGEVSAVTAERPEAQPELVVTAPDEEDVRAAAAAPTALSKAERQRVYVRLVRAERKAREQADQDYAIASLRPGYTREELEALLEARLEAQMTLLDRLRGDIAEKYGLSEEQMAQLFEEAIAENWPRL